MYRLLRDHTYDNSCYTTLSPCDSETSMCSAAVRHLAVLVSEDSELLLLPLQPTTCSSCCKPLPYSCPCLAALGEGELLCCLCTISAATTHHTAIMHSAQPRTLSVALTAVALTVLCCCCGVVRLTLLNAAFMLSFAGLPAYTPEQKGSMSLSNTSAPRLRLINCSTLSSYSTAASAVHQLAASFGSCGCKRLLP